MTENNRNNEEKDVKIYDTSDIIFEGKPKRARTAQRDIKPHDNEKTRVDMPTITEEIIPPKKVDSPYEEAPLLEEDEPMIKSYFEMFGKGIIYLIFVLASSVIIAYYGITIANDVFAFVKSDDEVKIVIEEGDGVKEIAKELKKAGVIEYPGVFKLYNSFKNRNSETPQEFVADTYVFEKNLNYDELIAKFEKSAPVRGVVDITFPEGLSVDEMIEIFLENGIGTRDGFVEAVKSSLIYDMKYPFLVSLQEEERKGFDDGRKYALEGYLYPDTYQFYSDSSEIDAVSKLLKTFNVRFEKEYYDRCEELGMTVDEIVNIASIVQKETKYSSEYPIVSSLYHNRLKNPSSFPRLQCDSTYLYAFPDRREGLTLDEMKASDSPYSTYSHDGLPPSAICSPSLDAIIAALYPNAQDSSGVNHTYYYMYARPNGYHYFARTDAEHQANIVKANAEKGE
ncbi:MAG: endolytic transglycosylase MltG [Clostridia bacterium]|nr:endolytic transglycosylase MltG [Clostridia bacterium]